MKISVQVKLAQYKRCISYNTDPKSHLSNFKYNFCFLFYEVKLHQLQRYGFSILFCSTWTKFLVMLSHFKVLTRYMLYQTKVVFSAKTACRTKELRRLVTLKFLVAPETPGLLVYPST